MNCKALVIRLQGPGDLYVVAAEDTLARLRIIQDGIVVIDIVLRRKIAGVGCCPVLIQCITDFLISHAALPDSTAHESDHARRHTSTARRYRSMSSMVSRTDTMVQSTRFNPRAQIASRIYRKSPVSTMERNDVSLRRARFEICSSSRRRPVPDGGLRRPQRPAPDTLPALVLRPARF